MKIAGKQFGLVAFLLTISGWSAYGEELWGVGTMHVWFGTLCIFSFIAALIIFLCACFNQFEDRNR